MLSCREVSELVSQSLDRKLPLRQRIGIRLHLAMCRLCSRFRKDLLRLRQAASQHADETQQGTALRDVSLPSDARQAIRQALEEAGW